MILYTDKDVTAVNT